MKKIFTISFFLILLLISNISFAKQFKILIVNSNSAVARYEKISTAFQEQLRKNNYLPIEFNLGGREDHLESRIDLQQVIKLEEPDIVYCIGSKAYELSKEQIKDRILLFASIINWKKLNINNMTYGIANELSPEQEIMQLRLLFPDIKKIGLLYSEENNLNYVETIKNNAHALKTEIVAQPINDLSDIDAELKLLLPKIDLFWLIPDPLVLQNKDSILQIFQIAQQQNKPIYAYSDTFMEYGAILNISSDAATIGNQSAAIVMLLQQSTLIKDKVLTPIGTHVNLNICMVDKLKINFNKKELSSVAQLTTKCQGNER